VANAELICGVKTFVASRRSGVGKDSCAGEAIKVRILFAAPRPDADMAGQSMALQPKILILSLPHGAAHQRAAKALREAFATLCPDARVEVIDTLQHCTAWFRAYYNSYLIPLAIWPGLWRWIESRQHQSESTGPGWVYRRGAQPLFRYLRDFAPDVVIATEVGTCELAAMYKREVRANFSLVGLELMDFNRAWVQPEVDLFLTTHVDLAAELVAAGAPAAKVVTTGQPIDPAFTSLPDRRMARQKLGVKDEVVQILILFGGTGHGNPQRILAELAKVKHPHEVVLVTGRNRRLERRLRKQFGGLPNVRVLGWVDNMQEWMVASDLMISKPGGSTLNEGFACGLPMLAFDPLPGNEERTCRWIEKWGAGVWIKKPDDLGPKIESLLADPAQLATLRHKAAALARPYAARDGALAVSDVLARTENAARSKQ
jgi:processive 1,2-diacylglycerol beta-glucosyltransferase